MAVTETASTLITSWTLLTCDWILCPSFKQQKKNCCSLPSSSLGLTEAYRQWAFEEEGKQENRVKFEFSLLPKCHYSLNPDVYPSCLAYEENINIGLWHVSITLNVSFTNEGMNEWVLHQVSSIDDSFFREKRRTPLCVVAHRSLTWPLCHSLGFGCLLGTVDQMQSFHNWLYAWEVLLWNDADGNNEHICSPFHLDRWHH